jgi:hypothetical protein
VVDQLKLKVVPEGNFFVVTSTPPREEETGLGVILHHLALSYDSAVDYIMDQVEKYIPYSDIDWAPNMSQFILSQQRTQARRQKLCDSMDIHSKSSTKGVELSRAIEWLSFHDEENQEHWKSIPRKDILPYFKKRWKASGILDHITKEDFEANRRSVQRETWANKFRDLHGRWPKDEAELETMRGVAGATVAPERDWPSLLGISKEQWDSLSPNSKKNRKKAYNKRIGVG